MTERQRVMLALVASALLHLAVITLFIVSTWFKLPVPRLTLPEPKPLEVTIMNRALPRPTPMVVKVVKAAPPPKPVATPVPQKVFAKPTPPPEKVTRHVLSNDGLTPSQTAPKNPAFEADVNSVAASEQPGKGRGPLPSQEGKERPFMQFETKKFTLGATPAPAAPDATPVGYSKIQPTPAPTPEARFQPTPIPGKAIATPAPNALSIARATPAPTPPARSTPTPEQLSRLNPQPRPLVPKSGYRPETEKTKIEGGISNKGKASVDALGTPLGRYRKAVADAIGSRWYYYVNQRMDLIAVGDVHIRFYVNQKGRVESLRILNNSANESLGTFCVQAVNEAQIPPIPADVIPKLEGGRLEIEYEFNIYPQ